jgi:prepilin-type N-terminal cleavage/methylation domain-containing protein
MKRHMKHQVSAFLFLLGKSLRTRSGTSTSGFTLIESLVAIIVISVTVVAISPPIFWAAATRVQNRRAEQALSIAQSSIDEVRAKIERGSYTLNELPELAPSAAGGIRPYPSRGPAPNAQWTGAKRCMKPDLNTVSSLSPAVKNYPPIDQYLAVDTNGGTAEDANCEPDFLVQIFRNEGICATGACNDPLLPPDQRKPVAFSVGVRVYSAIAKNSGVATLDPEKSRLTGTTGTGQSGFRPLAVLYSTVAKSDSSTALNRYRELCKSGSDKTICE